MQKNTESTTKQLFHWSKGDVGRKQHNPKFGHSITLVGDVLLMFGGYSTEYLSSLSYLFEGKMWKEIQCAGTIPRGRSGHCAFAYKGKLYIWSGDSGENCLDDLWCFNPRTLTWERIITENNPTPRSWASCCVVDDWMIMAGGENRYQQGLQKGSYKIFWDQWALHLPTMKWYSMFDENIITPCPRIGHSMVSVGNMVIVFGGAIPAEWYKTTRKNRNDETDDIINNNNGDENIKNNRHHNTNTGDRAMHDDNVMIMKIEMPTENLNIDNVQYNTATSPKSIEVNSNGNAFEVIDDPVSAMDQATQDKYLVNDIWYFFVEYDEPILDSTMMEEGDDTREIRVPVAHWVRGNYKAPMDIFQKPDEIKTAAIIPAPRAFQTMGTGAISKESISDKIKSTLVPIYIYGGISIDGPVSDIWRLDIIIREELETVKYSMSNSSYSQGTTQQQITHLSPFDASISVVSACFPGLSPTAYEDTELKQIISACVSTSNNSTPAAIAAAAEANQSKMKSRAQMASRSRALRTAGSNATRPNSRMINATPNGVGNSPSSTDKSVRYDTANISASFSVRAERPKLQTRSSATREKQIKVMQRLNAKGQNSIVSFDILAPRGRYSMGGTIVPAHLTPARIQTGLGLYGKSRDQSSLRHSDTNYGTKEAIPYNASIFEKTKDRDILIINGGVGEAEKVSEASTNVETGETLPYSLLCDTWFIKMPEDAKLAHLQNSVDNDMAITAERNTVVTDIMNKTTESLINAKDTITEYTDSPHRQLQDVINKSMKNLGETEGTKEKDDNSNPASYSKDTLIGMVNNLQNKLIIVEDFTANSHIEAIKTINSMKRNLAHIAADGRKMGIQAKNLSRIVADEYSEFEKKVKNMTEQLKESYEKGKQVSESYFFNNDEQIKKLKELEVKIEMALSEFEDSVNNTFKMFDLKLVEYNEKFNVCTMYIDNFDQYQKNHINVFLRKAAQFQDTIEKIRKSLYEMFCSGGQTVDAELARISEELEKKKQLLTDENQEDFKKADLLKQEFIEKLKEVDEEIDKFNAKTMKQTEEDSDKFARLYDGLHRSIVDDHKKQRADFDKLMNNVQQIIKDKNMETDTLASEINNLINETYENAKKAREDAETHYNEGADKIKNKFAEQINEIDNNVNENNKVFEDYRTGIMSLSENAIAENDNEIREHVDKTINEHNTQAKEELMNRIDALKQKILDAIEESNKHVEDSTTRVQGMKTLNDEAQATYNSENERIINKIENMKKQLNDIKESLEMIAEKSKEKEETTKEHNTKYDESLNNYIEKCKDNEENVKPEFERRIAENTTAFESTFEEANKEFDTQKEKIEQVEAKLVETKVPKIPSAADEITQKINETIAANKELIENNKNELIASNDEINNKLDKFNEDKQTYADDVKNFETSKTEVVGELHNQSANIEDTIAKKTEKYAFIIEQERKLTEQEEILKNNNKYHAELENGLNEKIQSVRDNNNDIIREYTEKTDEIIPKIKEETQKALEDYNADTKAKYDEFDTRAQELKDLNTKSDDINKATEEFIKEFDEKIYPNNEKGYNDFKEDIANYESDKDDIVAGLNAFIDKKMQRVKLLIENATDVVSNQTPAHREGWINEIKNYIEENIPKIEEVFETSKNDVKEKMDERNIPMLLDVQNVRYNNIDNCLRIVDSSISDINVRLHTFQDDLRRARKETEPTSTISSRAFVSCDNLMKSLVDGAETTKFMKLRTKGGDISSVSARNSLKQVRGASPSSRTPATDRNNASPNTPNTKK